jgi:HEAT repeat protein
MPLFKKSKVNQFVKEKDVASLIATATSSDPPKVRADAVQEFPRFATEIETNHLDAARAALNQACRDAKAEVRGAALFAWAELRWSESVDRLLAGLEDDNWMVRVFAVTMLGRFDDDRIPTRLAKTLNDDSDGMVREAAASSLGQLGDPSTIEALRRAATGDREREVRKAAEQALKSFS